MVMPLRWCEIGCFVLFRFRCHSHIGANSVFDTQHTRTYNRASCETRESFRSKSRFYRAHTRKCGHLMYWARGKMDANNVYAKERKKTNWMAVLDMHFRAKRKRDKRSSGDFRAATTLYDGTQYLTVWDVVKHAEPILYFVSSFLLVRCGAKYRVIHSNEKP